MNTTESLKRNQQEKLDILEVSNELWDATFKQNQAAVLQTLGTNLSRPSLYRLETNPEKIVQQPSGNWRKIKITYSSNPKVLFSV